MRATNGKRVRKYVYDVRLGDNKAAALYRGDEKLWPTLSDTVYSCVLDVNELEGSVDKAYWVHALDAVEKLGKTADCSMNLRAGGREYTLNAAGVWRADFDGRATVVFGDNGPLWEKLQPGDAVEVVARIPARNGERLVIKGYETWKTLSWEWPLIAGARFGMELSNFSRKRSTYSYFRMVKSLPSGREWNAYKGSQKHVRKPLTKEDLIKEPSLQPGDTTCSCEVMTSGGCYYDPSKGQFQYVFPVWPAFTRVFRFKVSAVTRHG